MQRHVATPTTSLVDLPSDILALITPYLELVDVITLSHRCGNTILKRTCANGGVKRLNSKVIESFGFRVPPIASYRHLTHLSLDFGKVRSAPVFPLWTLHLPPTLLSVRIVTAECGLECFVQPLSDDESDRYVRHCCSIEGFTPQLLCYRLPLLHTLHLRSKHFSTKLWNQCMVRRFMDHLPPSLTSLALPLWIQFRLSMWLPPPKIMQNLVELITPSDSQGLSLARDLCSHRTAASPLLTETTKLDTGSLAQVREADLKDFPSSFPSMLHLHLRDLDYNEAPKLAEYLPNLLSLKVNIKNLQRNSLNLPNSLTSLRVNAFADDIPGILRQLPRLTSFKEKYQHSDNSQLVLDCFPPQLKSLSVPRRALQVKCPTPNSLTSLKVLHLDSPTQFGYSADMASFFVNLERFKISRLPSSSLPNLPRSLRHLDTLLELEEAHKTCLDGLTSFAQDSVAAAVVSHLLPQVPINNFVGSVEFPSAVVQHILQLIPRSQIDTLDRLIDSFTLGDLKGNFPPSLTHLERHSSLMPAIMLARMPNLKYLSGTIGASLPHYMESSDPGWAAASRLDSNGSGEGITGDIGPLPELHELPDVRFPATLETLSLLLPRTFAIPPTEKVQPNQPATTASSRSLCIWPLLDTAPKLTTLELSFLPISQVLCLLHLPPTLTKLSMNLVDMSRPDWEADYELERFEVPALPPDWLPLLTSVSIYYGVSHIKYWLPRLRSFKLFDISTIIVPADLITPLQAESRTTSHALPLETDAVAIDDTQGDVITALNYEYLQRICRDRLFDSTARFGRTEFCVTWTSSAARTLPATVTSASLEYGAHQWQVYDEIEHWTRPSTLKESLNDFSWVSLLPASITHLALPMSEAPDYSNLTAFPAALRSLALEVRIINHKLFELLPRALTSLRITSPTDGLTTAIAKALPEGLLHFTFDGTGNYAEHECAMALPRGLLNLDFWPGLSSKNAYGHLPASLLRINIHHMSQPEQEELASIAFAELPNLRVFCDVERRPETF